TTSVPLADHRAEVAAAYGGTEDEWSQFVFTAHPHEDGNYYFQDDLIKREFPLDMTQTELSTDTMMYVMFYEPGIDGQIISYTYAREITEEEKLEEGVAELNTELENLSEEITELSLTSLLSQQPSNGAILNGSNI